MSLPDVLMPAALPYFLSEPHEVDLRSPYEDVPVSTGPHRRRRVTTTAPRDMRCALWLNQAQMLVFHRWFEHVLLAGTLEFTARVQKLGEGVEYWRARFLRREQEVPSSGYRWQVPCILRLTGDPSGTPPAITGMAMEIVVPLMARAALTSSWAMAMEISVPLNARVDSGGMAMEIGVELDALWGEATGGMVTEAGDAWVSEGGVRLVQESGA
jgi:hypothetical protein